MQQTWKSMVLGVTALFFLFLCGCGGGGDAKEPTPAALNGSEGEATKTSDSTTVPPKPEQDPAYPTVVIETTLGSFTVRLDAQKSPLTVDNFLAYIADRHYENTVFHQVLQEYPKVAIGGAYALDLSEKKARGPIYNEAHNGLKNRRGTIGMARQADSVHSATCHFYVNLADNAVLDHKDRSVEGYGYCVFGEVVEGMEVVERIGQAPVHDTDKFERIPVDTVAIKSARRIK